ncbi:MAG: DUF2163 domain-containing protein [Pyrinomonadaceae bacterium]
MKTLGAGPLADIAAESSTFCLCWLITRRDGTVKGFTSNVVDVAATLTGAGKVTFKAATGTTVSNLQTSAGRGIDNLSAYGVINSGDISEADLLKGLYDDAQVVIAIVNYVTPANFIVVATGFLGEVKIGRKAFETEVRTLLVRANQAIGKVCSPLCRVKVLGDSECTVNLTSFTFAGQTVSAVTSRSQFSTASAGVVGKAAYYFAYGKLTWTSGANSGKAVEVRSHNTSSPCLLTLAEIMPYDIQIGDAFTIIAGCDRRLESCRDRFSNVLNFRGEPYIPGTDAVLRIIAQ